MLIFAIAALIGIVKKQPRQYWFALLGGIGIQFLTGLLFAGNGTLADPTGDGIVTAMLRRATNDGGAVAFLIVPAVFFGWIVPLALLRHFYRRAPISQVQFPKAGAPRSTKP